jgi:large subunit ribosomal protein L10
MARPEKVAEVQAIAAKLQSAQSIVLTDFTGLTVEKMTAFRALCRSRGIECRVVKNRLAQIAAADADLEVIRDHLRGPTALILSPQSQVEPAKAVVDFAQENEALTIKGGIVDGAYIDARQVLALSRVPSRDELIGMLMASLQSPLTGFMGTLKQVPAALTRAFDAVAKQKAAA